MIYLGFGYKSNKKSFNNGKNLGVYEFFTNLAA